MSKKEAIIQAAREGKYVAMIARELGVSNQYVSLTLKKAGVKAGMLWQLNRDLQPKLRPPIPRVITGGVSVPISHAAAGTVSELLTAADLMARGWTVFMPILRNKGHDIIACKGEHLVTIEVRSGKLRPNGQPIFQKKADCKSNCYAIVMTGEPVVYDPPLPE